MHDARVRTARPADAAAAAMVASASFLAAFADTIAVADLLAHCAHACSQARFADWLADANTVVMLAEHPETAVPVGYSVLTAPDLPVAEGAADIELRRFYLMPAATGSGLASRMMARAVTDAAERGRDRLLLGVNARNTRARRFYVREGFVPIGERRFRVGAAWHDDIVYARPI